MSDPREDMNDLESAKQGDPDSDNNLRQFNARALIARKSEFLRAKAGADSGEELSGVDDGVADDDLAGGTSDLYAVTDSSLKVSLKNQPEQKSEPERARSYKIKVNGQELDLSEEELIARAQKVEAADRYLEEAKREAELLRAKAKLEAEAPSVQDAPQEVSEDELELVRTLQIGDEHTAAKKLREYLSKQKPVTAINEDAVAWKAADAIEFKNAVKWFQNEYKDVFADQNLASLAYKKDEEYRLIDQSKGTATPYMERYRQIGEEIRRWRGTSPEFEEKKQQKKDTLKSIPQASVRQAPPQEEEEEDNYQNTIESMAKARYQRNLAA